MRPQTMGVRVNEITAEMAIAKVRVKANSWKMVPRMPPMNRSGMKTATSDRLMEMTVKTDLPGADDGGF